MLTLAAAYDPTVLPSDPDDRRTKAEAWAAALSTPLTYELAQAAVIHHYRANTRTITVADLNAHTPTTTGALAAITSNAATATPPPADLDLHPHRTRPPDHHALTVACPWCRAHPHQPCTRTTDTTGPQPLTGVTAEQRARVEAEQRAGRTPTPPLPAWTVHPSRLAAAAESA